jgi:hypothetical protein
MTEDEMKTLKAAGMTKPKKKWRKKPQNGSSPGGKQA